MSTPISPSRKKKKKKRSARRRRRHRASTSTSTTSQTASAPDTRFQSSETDPRFLPIDARTSLAGPSQTNTSTISRLLDPSFQILQGSDSGAGPSGGSGSGASGSASEMSLKSSSAFGLGSLYKFGAGSGSGSGSGGSGGNEVFRAKEIRRELERQIREEEEEEKDKDVERETEVESSSRKSEDDEDEEDSDFDFGGDGGDSDRSDSGDDDEEADVLMLSFRERLELRERRERERKRIRLATAAKNANANDKAADPIPFRSLREIVRKQQRISPWEILELGAGGAGGTGPGEEETGKKKKKKPKPEIEFDANEGVLWVKSASSGEEKEEGEEENEENEENGELEEEEESDPTTATTTTSSSSEDAPVPVAVITSLRIAFVNHDFDLVNLKDMFAIFQSFCPQGGSVVSAAKYYSKIGLEALLQKEEETLTPNINVFRSPEELERLKREKVEREMAVAEEKLRPMRKRVLGLSKRDKLDSAKVVLYELSRLRHFFGLVVFDSPATAEAVYDACDGMDVEDSQQYLDLRMVPPEKEFDEYLIAEGPVTGIDMESYLPDVAGRGRSRVFCPPGEFTWDRPSASRRRALSGADDVPEEEILQFVSDVVDEEDEEDEESIAKMRELLLSGTNEDEEEYGVQEQEGDGPADDDDDDGAPRKLPLEPFEEGGEIVFRVHDTDAAQQAKEALLAALRDQHLAKTETFHDRRRRRKRQQKRQRRKDLRSRREEEQHRLGGVSLEDGQDEDVARLKRLLHHAKAGEDETEFDINADRQREQQRVGHDRVSGRDTGFELEDDDRFRDLVEDPDFNLDPTHHKFKKTRNVEQIMLKKRKRKRDEMEDEMALADSHFFAAYESDKPAKKRRKKSSS